MQDSDMKGDEGALERYQIQWGGIRVDISRDSEGVWLSSESGKKVDIEARTPKALHLLINGRSMRLEHIIRTEEGDLILRLNGLRYCLPIKNRRELLHSGIQAAGIKRRKQTALKAPMPGLVLRLMVTEGQALQAGDPILVLESMKMENVLRAQSDCTIVSAIVQPGEAVEKGQILVNFL